MKSAEQGGDAMKHAEFLRPLCLGLGVLPARGFLECANSTSCSKIQQSLEALE